MREDKEALAQVREIHRSTDSTSIFMGGKSEYVGKATGSLAESVVGGYGSYLSAISIFPMKQQARGSSGSEDLGDGVCLQRACKCKVGYRTMVVWKACLRFALYMKIIFKVKSLTMFFSSFYNPVSLQALRTISHYN